MLFDDKQGTDVVAKETDSGGNGLNINELFPETAQAGSLRSFATHGQ